MKAGDHIMMTDRAIEQGLHGPKNKRFGRLKYLSRKRPGMVRVQRIGDKHPSNWHESLWGPVK